MESTNLTNRYHLTRVACYFGYIVQAVVVIYPSLLFTTFQREFGISLTWISVLITINFVFQLGADIVSPYLIRKFGYRYCLIGANIMVITFLLGLNVLPYIIKPSFLGVALSIALGAVGAGLIEVMISPIISNCPSNNKEAEMSVLHSFYCWGCCVVILGSSVFFALFGMSKWHILTVLWISIPVLCFALLIYSPIPPMRVPISCKEAGSPRKTIILVMLLMFCTGACEHVMSQWASTIAEQELGWQKTIGDLACPLMFATAMGLGRLFLPKLGKKISTRRLLGIMCFGCGVGYFMIAMGTGAISVIGFIIGGFCVSVLWPYICALAAEKISISEPLLFALMAIAGDIGCALGPALIPKYQTFFGTSLKRAELGGIVFPLVAGIMILYIFQKQTISTIKKD